MSAPAKRARDGATLLTHWEGEPVAVWESLWGVPLVEVWGSLGSTNDRARELARTGAPTLSVVLAEEQTAGRGRGGRAWSSPHGLGLWMSVLLRPSVVGVAPLVPLLVGLATCRAVEHVSGLEPRIKWPNDLFLEGRKLAGVLCELEGTVLLLGVGVNVRQQPNDFPEALRSSAWSLEGASQRPVSRGKLAGALLTEMQFLLSRPPLRLEGRVADEIASRDGLRGLPVSVEGGPQGTAMGIDPRGRLVVRTADGTLQHAMAGTVRPVAPNPSSASSET